MPRARRPLDAALTAVVLALLACRSHPSTAPRVTNDGSRVERASAAGARILVDVSESNRGFARPGSVALESVQRALDGALAQVGWSRPMRRCSLDESVHCGSAPMEPSAFRSPALYRGRNAALHLVLRHGGDSSGEDPLDAWAVTVMVTDGFESSAAAFVPDASTDVACSRGADPNCIAALLRERVNEGFGVWVVRAWMPFSGRYFAERRLDAASWQRVQDHVSALASDPSWEGVRFAASGADLGSESGPFTLVGARPLLTFVLSRDAARARTFVDEFVRRVRLEHVTARGADAEVTASEWAPFEGFTATLSRAVRADNGGAADEVIVDRARRGDDGLRVPVQCNLRGRSRIRVEGEIVAGAVPPPSFARVAFEWRRAAGTRNDLLLPHDPLAPRAGSITATPTIDCTTMPPGASRYELLLWGSWSLDETAFADSWFARESAETSYEMPERVYGLAALAHAVIERSVHREGALDRAVFAVERE